MAVSGGNLSGTVLTSTNALPDKTHVMIELHIKIHMEADCAHVATVTKATDTGRELNVPTLTNMLMSLTNVMNLPAVPIQLEVTPVNVVLATVEMGVNAST